MSFMYLYLVLPILIMAADWLFTIQPRSVLQFAYILINLQADLGEYLYNLVLFTNILKTQRKHFMFFKQIYLYYELLR